jgi:membrane protein implicated in regulation of membrane protease activity
VLALFTPWGLASHWWVLAKCVIAAVLTVAGLLFLVPAIPQIIAGSGEPSGMQTLIARSVALVLLLAATGLSVVKPWGKTPRGRQVHKRVSILVQQK